ncbi:hypothetical protein GCM10010836_25010 [Aminobacter aminovorans]
MKLRGNAHLARAQVATTNLISLALPVASASVLWRALSWHPAPCGILGFEELIDGTKWCRWRFLA